MNATRRGVLVGLGVSAMALVGNDNAQARDDDYIGECERLARKLVEAFERKHGGSWKFEIDHISKFALIIPIE